MGNEAPEVWEECPDCHGEGGIEVWESVSKWSIDPPCAHVVFCRTCNGSGGMICEAEGDNEANDFWARGEHMLGVTW